MMLKKAGNFSITFKQTVGLVQLFYLFYIDLVIYADGSVCRITTPIGVSLNVVVNFLLRFLIAKVV